MSGQIAGARKRMDIERLVSWALVDQGLGWMGKDRPKTDQSDLGTRVDISPGVVRSPSVALWTDDDALVVKAGIDALPIDARELVFRYGRARLRPEGADEQLGQPAPLLDKRGRVRRIYSVPGNKRSPSTPMLDWLGYSARKEAIDFARAQWTLWREGLIALVDPLNQRLEGHFATGPEAPAEPWELPAPVIHGVESRVPELRELAHDPDQRTIYELRVAAQADIVTRPLDWDFPKR